MADQFLSDAPMNLSVEFPGRDHVIPYNLTSLEAQFFRPNDTGNSTNGTEYQNNLFTVTPGLVVLLSILYGSISVTAVLGNFLVILVIVKNKSMQTVTNFFIANLSVADVMIGIFSIPFQFQAALLQRWDLPHILCPVAPFVKELSVNISIITLTVISIDRYFAVIHPLKPRCSSKTARLVMLVVWGFSLGSSVPVAIVFRVIYIPDSIPGTTKPFCAPAFPSVNGFDLGQVYMMYITIVQYFFPLLIISFAYFRIMHTIWLTKAPGSAMDSRDAIMNRNKKKVREIRYNYCLTLKLTMIHLFQPTQCTYIADSCADDYILHEFTLAIVY